MVAFDVVVEVLAGVVAEVVDGEVEVAEVEVEAAPDIESAVLNATKSPFAATISALNLAIYSRAAATATLDVSAFLMSIFAISTFTSAS